MVSRVVHLKLCTPRESLVFCSLACMMMAMMMFCARPQQSEGCNKSGGR
jgi:hypothetical protein